MCKGTLNNEAVCQTLDELKKLSHEEQRKAVEAMKAGQYNGAAAVPDSSLSRVQKEERALARLLEAWEAAEDYPQARERFMAKAGLMAVPQAQAQPQSEERV